MDRFDTGLANAGFTEIITSFSTTVLAAPLIYAWTPWASKNLPNTLEWVLVVCNSMLWGLGLASIYIKFRKPHNHAIKADEK